MNKLPFSIVIVCAVLLPNTATAQDRNLSKKARIVLRECKNLPGFAYYKAEPYLRAAVDFQALGQEQASKLLMSVARDNSSVWEAPYILCRMLFTNKENGTFRRPRIGGPSLTADWPLEPITLVDGVPFLITRGYMIGGLPEASRDYVQYCIENCAWNRERFHLKSKAEERAALAKLLASPQWRTPLHDNFKEFLVSQVP